MKHRFQDLIDVSALQRLTDDLYAATGIPSAIIAMDGEILTGSGWQRICTDFHRKHPEIERDCIESDIRIRQGLDEGEPYVLYECPRGLVDASAPVVIEGEHVANVFAGQLFVEPPDRRKEELFRSQAKRFGLDEEAYVQAFREIPVMPEAKLRPALRFLARLAEVVAKIGLARLREREAAQELAEREVLLKKSSERLTLHIRQTPLGYIEWNDRFEVVDWNPSAERIFGFTREEALHRHAYELIVPSAAQTDVAATWQRVAEGKWGTRRTNENITKSGRRITCDWYNTPLKNAEGKVIGVASLVDDITERKQTEQALRESEEKLRALFDHSGDAIFISDEEGRFIEVNLTTLERYGYSRQELLGMRVSDVNWPDQAKLVPGRTAKLLREGAGVFETTHRTKDGRAIPVEVSARAIRMSGQTLVIATARDMTERQRAEEERRKLEQQMQQSQKLESLGVLAGGIAHDFNNILMVILGNAELALRHLSPVAPGRENLREITKASQRAADLARQMLAYSGRGRFVVEPVDLGELVQEMTHMLAVSISKKVTLQYAFAPDVPPVEADATQLRQIVMNLVINASEAIGDRSGVIAVSTGAVECDRGCLSETWLDDELSEGLYAYVEVADTGCGMDRETLPKIFDPFYTTKFTGRGLGLAAVLGIVRGHRGALKVCSEPGKGSKFRVLLPPAQRPATGPRADEVPSAEWHGTGTVLLADDEETIRMLGKEMLEELGFRVLTAADGFEAVEVLREHGDEVVCVLLDLTMPRMDGEEALLGVRRVRRDVPVILSSGYTEQEVTQRFAGGGLAGFIQKPYRLASLKAKIREALAWTCKA